MSTNERTYASGPIIQNISRSAREASLFGPSARDYDARASHPSIIKKMAEDCPTLGDTPAIRRYVDDAVGRRRLVSEALEIATDRAKGIVNLTFYGGDPFRAGREAELPDVYLVSQEVRMAADGIPKLPRIAYLSGHSAFAGTAGRPVFSILSYALGTIEDSALWKANEIFPNTGAQVHANMHGGLIVGTPRDQHGAAKKTLAAISASAGCIFVWERAFRPRGEATISDMEPIAIEYPFRDGRDFSNIIVAGRSQCLWNSIRAVAGSAVRDAVNSYVGKRIGPFPLSEAQRALRGSGIRFIEIGVECGKKPYTCVAQFSVGPHGHFVGVSARESSVGIFDKATGVEVSIWYRHFAQLCVDLGEMVFLIGSTRMEAGGDAPIYEDCVGGGSPRFHYTALARCVRPCGGRLFSDVRKYQQAAQVWAGSRWGISMRGRKRCGRCRFSYRPSWRWVGGEKIYCASRPPM